MARWFVEKIVEETGFLNSIRFSDEAHFFLNGQVNSRNNVYWGTVPPGEVRQRSLHSGKGMACCVMRKHGIVVPSWFEDEDGDEMTINSECYIKVLNEFEAAVGQGRSF